MAQYRPQNFEKKWQELWDKQKSYRTPNPGDMGFDSKKPSYYVLDMFPYPSGSGLHVGHASGYIGTDIIARKKRMEGFNVLHPMGWDAFGLPAEQYAIQTGQHPRKTTEINTQNFRNQLKKLGLSYDWDREVDTSTPEYYKWTQWLFLKLYEKGLVYEKEVPVWWCEDLKTVLANEEVINGRSERGNYPCERRPLRQWVLKITAYADRLVEDLKLLDWPESVKKMQVDWVGKSEGAEIDFAIENNSEKIRVFSTRPDTLFGVNAVVLAPEHHLVASLTTPAQKSEVDAYVQMAKSKSERDRKAEVKEITGAFTGSYAFHPLHHDQKIPIYIADYVIADYGTGAVMSVSAHDERDHSFAKKMGLKVKRVILAPTEIQASLKEDDCYTGEGILQNSPGYDGLSSEAARKQITIALEKLGRGEKKITYKLKDWVFSRQRYWGEPFPLAYDSNGEIVPAKESELPILLPDMTDFKPSADGASPLARVPEWVNFKNSDGRALKRVTDTMPGWAGSCWYFLRFMDPKNSQAAFSKEAVNYWKQVDLYIGGTSHAVMHLLYARFWHKVFFDFNLVPEPEPFKKLFNQGMVTAYAYRDQTQRLVPSDDVEAVGAGYRRKSTGETLERIVTKMAKSLKNVVNPDDVIEQHGCDVLRIYEMFMGPLDSEKAWADEAVPGCERFLRRLWNIFVQEDEQIFQHLLKKSTASPDLQNDKQVKLERAIQKCLKRVNETFGNFNFNVAVASFMECLNTLSEHPEALSREQAETFLKILSPFCPHFSAELWSRLGNTSLIDYEAWPELKPEFLQENDFELVISVNGKPRKKLQVKRGTTANELEEIAKAQVTDWTKDQEIKKVIVVVDKLVNIVCAPKK